MTEQPTVTDVRRSLMSEAADFHKRRQPHRHAMKIDNYNDIASDAYEGLAVAGCYAQLLSAILADLIDHGQEDLAYRYVAFIHDVMENGDDGLEDANDDIPWGAEAAQPAETTQQLARRYGSAADAQDANTEK